VSAKYRLFCGMRWKAGELYGDTQEWTPDYSGFWFRVLGYGLHISTRQRKDAYFSERNGWRKALYVFGLRFEVLRR
jgi:hypothetical protein